MREDWEVRKLGEVATYINGYAFKPNQWSEKGLPIIRIQNLNDNDALYNYCEEDIPSKYLVNNGDILISWSASLGVYEWLNDVAYLNQHIFKVVFNKLEINKYYFKYAVNTKIDHMIKNAHGATMKHIVKKDFDNTKIYYPPLQTQHRIVEELDCLTSIIEKQKKQLGELDNLEQAIFYDMFGDPIENEKGWNVNKMDDICNITSSKRIYSHEYVESGIPFYRGKEITEKCKSLNLSVELFISVEKYKELKENFGVPQIGDLLLTAVGTIGNIWIVDTETPFYFKDGNILWLKNLVNITPIFLKFLLEFQISEFKNKLANGCAYNALTIMNLKELYIIIPPLPLQQQFASKIEAIEKQKELIKKSIKETEDLFNSRMDYYFN